MIELYSAKELWFTIFETPNHVRMTNVVIQDT